MSVVEWLNEYAPGFQGLSDGELQAITEFLLLWSLFEARSLNERGSASAIVNSANRWAASGQLTEDTFSRELAYFRDRYVADGEFTRHFKELHLRKNDEPDLVKKVLSRENIEPREISAAVLIIVYRYRNNLFHGVKWSYALRGQFHNFEHANTALIQAIDLHEVLTPGEPA